jgi:rifampicin phosphotransferase
LARRMFRAIGREFAACGALEYGEDIFYLRLEEIRGAFEGTISHRELKPLVALRKQLEREDHELIPPDRFTTTGIPYWNGNLEGGGWFESAADTTSAVAGRKLYGTPCSPGSVEGEARVIRTPSDVGGGILVAYRTDPGWTPILASASALLIERGSPLTHVAIVARELGLPTVVQIKGLTREIHTGMRLRVDGEAGTITVLD